MARRRGLHPGFWIAIAIAVATACGLFGADYMRQRSKNIAAANAAAIDGLPCPELAAEDFAARGKPLRHQFAYADLQLGRAAGHVECQDIASNGGTGMGVVHVCQFTSPATLSVAKDGETRYFEPGVGKPATIVAESGDIRCVLAANFTLN